MDAFADEVLHHNAPAWTNPGANLYKSPVDGSGRFFDLLFTRSTQQKLEMRVRDQNAITVATRRINMPLTGTWTTRIFTGQYHANIDCLPGSASPETLYAGILDLSPDAQNAHDHYVYGGGRRSTLDSDEGYSTVNYAGMVDNVTVQLVQRATTFGAYSGSQALLTQAGSRIYRPVEYWAWKTGTSNVMFLAGRRYQAVMVESGMQPGTKVTIPIDNAMSGLFMITGQGSWAYARCAVRIA
jgi:hypothetical protein